MTNMDQPQPNAYERAYHTLLAQLPEQVKAKVLQAKDQEGPVDPEVAHFIKSVVAMAEQDD